MSRDYRLRVSIVPTSCICMCKNVRVWRLWAPRWPWARVPCTLCTPYCYATAVNLLQIIGICTSQYAIHDFPCSLPAPTEVLLVIFFFFTRCQNVLDLVITDVAQAVTQVTCKPPITCSDHVTVEILLALPSRNSKHAPVCVQTPAHNQRCLWHCADYMI